jgi:RNA polymerase sigma-70 factor (ECF subfamily)
MNNVKECEVADEFLDHPCEDSFAALFRVLSPQLVAFFRSRGHEVFLAEDLSQEVMLKVYRKAGQIRDRRLFTAWLFKIARNAACKHFARCLREVPTVDLADAGDRIAAPAHKTAGGPAFEFREWIAFLDPRERDVMTLRFVEEWEYHEIAAARAIPIGTVQWRVFNSKKKLAVHLNPQRDLAGKAAGVH